MAITGEQIYNLTRAALASDPSTAAYAGMLPDPTASNIGEVGAIYNSDTMLQNAFLGAIVNKVASTIIETKSFQNPLGVFRKNTNALGDTTEEIFVKLVPGKAFNDGGVDESALRREMAKTLAAYHPVNRKVRYAVTLSEEQMALAFQSWDSFGSVFLEMISTTEQSNERDEYILNRDLMLRAYSRNHMWSVEVGDVDTEAGMKNFTKIARSTYKKLKFYNTMNAAGVENTAKDVYFLIPADVEASMDVEVLAAAFNIDKTEFLGRKIVVDEFPDKNIVGFMIDVNFPIIKDKFRGMRTQNNAKYLLVNYFYHVQQTVAYSMFAPAVAFVRQLDPSKSLRILPEVPALLIGGQKDGSLEKIKSVDYHVESLAGDLNDPNKTLTVTATVDSDILTATVVQGKNGRGTINFDVKSTAAYGERVNVKLTATLTSKSAGTAEAPAPATVTATASVLVEIPEDFTA